MIGQLLQWRDRHGVTTRHGSRVLNTSLNGLRAAGHGFGTGHGGSHFGVRAGNGLGLVALSAGRNDDEMCRFDKIWIVVSAGEALDLVARVAGTEQCVTGAGVDGYRGQGGCGNCRKEDSSFHINFLFLVALCFAPPIGCIFLTPAGWKSRRNFRVEPSPDAENI